MAFSPDVVALSVKAVKGGGGGSDATNYNDLTNKPKINGVTLAGDKSFSDLGIASIPNADIDALFS